MNSNNILAPKISRECSAMASRRWMRRTLTELIFDSTSASSFLYMICLHKPTFVSRLTKTASWTVLSLTSSLLWSTSNAFEMSATSIISSSWRWRWAGAASEAAPGHILPPTYKPSSTSSGSLNLASSVGRLPLPHHRRPRQAEELRARRAAAQRSTASSSRSSWRLKYAL